ncbi:MAG: DUF4339 domain-containing protein [Myxococcota bacterium]
MTQHPDNRQWFCNSPEGNKGPFSHSQMLELMSRGVVTGQTWIWRDGFDNWTMVRDSGDFPETSSATSATSPSQDAAQALEMMSSQQRDDHLDGIFSKLVENSWERYNRRLQASEVDEVLVGAVITATLDNGYALIDLESDGTSHRLRFEQLSSGNRIIFRLTHNTGNLLSAKVLGHEAKVTVGYGERVREFGRVWKALRQEMKGGYVRQAEPGIITVDGDMSSQYVYVLVGMIWDLDDYLDPNDPYVVRYPKLTEDIGASIHALRKYLKGRLGS